MSQSADRLLDARGLYCPEPVMLLHSAIKDMGAGDTVLVLATDPSTQRDIPKFCGFLGHVLMSSEQLNDEYHYRICKSAFNHRKV